MPPSKGPEHEHYVVVNADGGNGNSRFACIYCEEEFAGTATRMRSHLSGSVCIGVKTCKKVPAAVKAKMLEREGDVKKALLERKRNASLDKLSTDLTSPSSGASANTSSIKAAFNTKHQAAADEALAKLAFAQKDHEDLVRALGEAALSDARCWLCFGPRVPAGERPLV